MRCRVHTDIYIVTLCSFQISRTEVPSGKRRHAGPRTPGTTRGAPHGSCGNCRSRAARRSRYATTNTMSVPVRNGLRACPQAVRRTAPQAWRGRLRPTACVPWHGQRTVSARSAHGQRTVSARQRTSAHVSPRGRRGDGAEWDRHHPPLDAERQLRLAGWCSQLSARGTCGGES